MFKNMLRKSTSVCSFYGLTGPLRVLQGETLTIGLQFCQLKARNSDRKPYTNRSTTTTSASLFVSFPLPAAGLSEASQHHLRRRQRPCAATLWRAGGGRGRWGDLREAGAAISPRRDTGGRMPLRSRQSGGARCGC